MTDGDSQFEDRRALVVALLAVGTFIWLVNPFPFFGGGPLQLLLPDEYSMRTIDQLRQAGVLHPFSKVFLRIEFQAWLLLTLAVAAFSWRNVKLAAIYLGLIIICSIIPWVRVFSELSNLH